MDAETRARFEAAGWTVGSTQAFLGLTDEEMVLLREVPAEEAWLWQNPAALKSVQQGLKDSAEGRVLDRPAAAPRKP